MTSFELLAQLRKLDVTLWAEGDQLCYDAPDGALTADLLTQLAAHKAEILTLLHTARRAVRTVPPSIRPVARDRELPLSFAQERLWFIDQLQPGSSAYNIPSVLRLGGALDLVALARSLDAIVQRHEVLRTTLAPLDDHVIQRIMPAAAVPLPVIDMRALPADIRDAATQRCVATAAQRPFDLMNGPLLRVTLFQLDCAEYVLLVVMHHIISDGWSMGVFIREMVAFYTAFTSGTRPALPALPVQYADFAVWQRQRLQGDHEDWGQGDKETRRQGDKETRSTGPQHPTPNTQHPTPIQTQLAYWLEQLRGAPTVLELPTDRPRPPVQTFRGAVHLIELPIRLSKPLTTLGQREGATLFMTLLAAFAALLYRYTGQQDMLVGTSIANRNHVQLEGLIGFFANTLVLRADLAGNPSFRELLRRVREVALHAYAHQDLPFEKLVEELHPQRSLNHTPLFQVLFALQNTPVQRLELPDLSLRPLAIANEVTKFDLSLSMEEGGQGVRGAWSYNSDLFDAATIARMDQHFTTLLEEVVAHPDRRVEQLPLLADAERWQLLFDWNATSADYPQDLCVHQLIAAPVAQRPDAVAVVFDRPPTTDHRPPTTDHRPTATDLQQISDPARPFTLSPLHPFTPSPAHPPSPGTQHLSYHELHRRANQLAAYLQTLGVGPEVLVGLCMERSLDLLVGLLGILSAGGACVPLDPAYPAERLAFMLEDAQVAVLLTTTDHRPPTTDHRPPTTDHRSADTVTLSPLHLVTLSRSWSAIALCAAHNPVGALDPANLAYVIYTSGSTGRPKGVLLPHSGLRNRLQWGQDTYRLTADDRVLHKAPISFDAAIWEIFWPLSVGATLVLARPDGQRDSAYLADLIAQQQLTVIHFVPAMLRVFLDQADPVRCASLRRVFCGGEALPADLRNRCIERLAVTLYNQYGPTEASVNTTFWAAQPHDPWPTSPIGRPISNARIYLLDAQLQPVPIGISGELYIGGAGLARGYLNRPDLTAERFVPNPFVGDKETRRQGDKEAGDDEASTQNLKLKTQNLRLYRTGDWARYRADGVIEFLGRTDEQLKLRGFRIEPGEIEAALLQHAAVHECAVVAREDREGDVRLVAYVVPTNDQRPTTNDQHDGSGQSSFVVRRSSFVDALRAFLQTRLPDYMLPTAFVLLDALPRTPSGKIDRRALPAPDQGRASLDASFVAPRTPTEELVASVWATVLGLEQVGIHDSFFALGGHSLLATQVIARLRQVAGVELPLRVLFEAPTIAGLATEIERSWHELIGPPPPIMPVARCASSTGSGQALPLSFAQQRLWFLDQLVPNSPFYNVSTTMRLSGSLQLVELAQTFQAIIARHETLRTTFPSQDGQPLQHIAPSAPLALTLLDLHALPAAQRLPTAQLLGAAQVQRPFDLARGPLLRILLLRLDAADHVVVLTTHHIISDGWSMAVFIRELVAFYQAHTSGRAPAPPQLPIQYADFALWQRGWLQGAVLEAQLAYWRQQLAAAPTLALPTDRPRPALQSYRGATQQLALPPPLYAALTALSQQEHVTLFMTLLTAFQVLLARYSGQSDLVVGTPIANRTRVEIEGLIGFFVNMLVLRGDLSGNPSVRELLGRVREVCLGAYAHQDLPFEMLVEALRPERDLSRNPLFQVLFALQNAPVATLESAEMTLRPLYMGDETAKFDLSLSVEEHDHELVGALEYNIDLFDASTITRLLGHFQTLLDGFVADPMRRLAELPLLNAAEQEQLLVAWSAGPDIPFAWGCVHELIHAQAERAPDVAAIIFPSTSSGLDAEQLLTYHELDRRANQLAHHLRRLGVGPEVSVGLALERSPEVMIGLLGILKAGGVYVPLDPAYPQERLAFMIADSQIAVLLTQKHIYDLRFTIYDLPASDEQLQELKTQNSKLKTPGVVCLDSGWTRVVEECQEQPDAGVTMTNLAYVIYTSGSTGQPKGVGIAHGAIVNHCAAVHRVFDLDAHDRALLFSSISFDASLEQILPTLCSGASLVLCGASIWSLAECLHVVEEVGITVLDVPSAYWHQLVQACADGSARAPGRHLRLVVVGGDRMIPESACVWQQTPLRSIRLLNAYGPTEATITVTTFEVPAGFCEDGQPRNVPIGRPLGDRTVFLLDQNGAPVPIGIPGELYIGGAGLARGYLNRPDLTAERFVPNPFAGDKETRRQGDKETGDGEASTQNLKLKTQNLRLYRTGDRARYRADGQIEFLGRTDEQLKLRGYRIEPGEIAAALLQHPAVHECAVVAREDREGDVRLVAYVVPTNDQRPTTNDQHDGSGQSSFVVRRSSFVDALSAFLQTRLPEYLVPAAFVLLDALPRTPSGKLDRRALPAPDQTGAGREAAFVAPRTPTEELVANIWTAVLGLEQVGIHDSFFALGGHSLLATQVIARLRQVAGVELPLRVLFEAPTIAGLAAQIERTGQVQFGPLPPIARATPRGALFEAPTIARLTIQTQRTGQTLVGPPPPIRPVARSASSRDSEQALPLSFAQQRLWFLDQLVPNSALYNVPVAVRLSGPLQLVALAQTFQAIIARHETLRTTFPSQNGQPLQRIAPSAPLALTVCDLAALPAHEREDAAHRLGAVEAQRPFDLAHGPLLRILLLRLDTADHVVVLTTHHIISDGWSMAVFIRELAAFYQAHTSGRAPALPQLPIQYADFALWQRGWLQGAVLEAQLAYWRQQLAAAPTLALPTDRPRPAIQTHRGATQQLALPSQLCAALTALSQQENITLFMTLLTAFQLLLARYSGQSDLVIGTPIANRTRVELEGLIGFFVNMLVLRGDLSGNPSVQGLLGRVREVCLGAYAHQDLPFEMLVEALRPERDLGRNPLFQVLFVFQNTPVATLESADMTLRPLTLTSGTAKFDLALAVDESGAGLMGTLEYSAELFDASTITRLLGHFQTLLDGFVADPARRLAELSLLNAAERAQLLVTWNATTADYPRDHCLHQLIAAQAARTPDAVAVVFHRPPTNDERPTTENQEPRTKNQEPRADDHTTTQNSKLKTQNLSSNTQHPTPNTQQLTYRELNERANRLAHHLRALGVGPEVPVAVCVERSLELVIGLLGVLKAGGAYLPLDPAYPAARLAFMLEDSQAAVLVTTTGEGDKETRRQGDKETESAHDVTLSPPHLVTLSQRAVIDLRADWELIGRQPADPPTSAVTADDTAYVIYTSGTTGRPKGVVVAHQQLVNALCATQAAFGLTRDDALLGTASVSFDIAVFELWSLLPLGGTAILMAAQQILDLPQIARLLRDATMVQAVPGLMRALVHFIQERGLQSDYTHLTKILSGGDLVPPDLIRAMQTIFPAAQVYVGYGPTEGTVICTTYAAPRDQELQSYAIGKPMQNMAIQLCDADRQLVPIGVVGELYLGGAGIARGYLNRPDLTAEKFIPNPFAGVTGDGCWVLGAESSNTQHPTPNTRLYRTGDLARYLPDGNLIFVGRIDEQVKVRGHRIELGEIEAVLAQHPAVRETVVVARADSAGEKQLVAYVVPKIEDRGLKIEDSGSDAPDPLSSILYSLSSELHAFLQERLPAYMIPAAFVLLEALPLTANGKIDRKALPAPDDRRGDLATTYIAPRGPVEELLAGIWAEVLGVAQPGVHDNFFALGGHSLLATQVLSRLRGVLQVDLPLRVLFEAPTVAELAARLATYEVAPGQAAPSAPALRPERIDGAKGDAGGPLPLSFAQQRLWFLEQLTPGSTAYNIPTAVQLTGALQVNALQQSLTLIVRRHSALRTTFANRDGQPVQLIGPPSPLPLPLLDLQALPALAREPTAHQLARIDAQQSFDLARGPLLRASLLRLDPQTHILLLMMHHIVSDGWSMGVLVRELVTLYQRGVQSQPMTLPDLPIQYADFAVWQRAWLLGPGVRGQGSDAPEEQRTKNKEQNQEHHDQESGVRGQGATASLPPPVGGGTEGGRSQESDVGERQTQNSKLKTQNSPLEAQLAYWEAQLAAPPTLDLLTDRPRPRIASAAGARQPLIIPHALHGALVALSRQADVTLFMTLLATWQVLLARYSGQDDIVVGTPIAGRTRVEVEALIGFFVNTLALRTDLHGAPTFRTLLGRVREVCLGAYAHQDIPFELLVESLQPTRDLSRNPLFQVFFALQNMPVTALELPELTLRLLDLDPETAQFDLSLILAETDAGLEGVLTYRTALFESTTITRLQQHFQTLLAAVVGNPDLCIAELPLLSAAEREQLLVAWNTTTAAYPTVCVHELVAAQAARTPDVVALVFDRPPTTDHRPTTNDQRPPLHPFTCQRLTYHELNRRANQLAHYLQALGVGPEVCVGVCLDRTPTLLIALLGVLKAGGAYLPLDPAYPRERLAFMLEDAQVAVLITTTDDRRPTTDQRPTTNDQRPTTNDRRSPAFHPRSSILDPQSPIPNPHPRHPITPSPRHLVTLSEAWPAIALYAANDPTGALDPANLAYVIYTSGSTGVPKGVAVPHRNVVARLSWGHSHLTPDHLTGLLATTSISFDVSVFELFAPLSSGGTVILAASPLALADLPATEAIGVLSMVPSALGELLRLGALPPTIHTIHLAGEPLPHALLAQLAQQPAHPQVLNLYGPSEDTIYSTWALVQLDAAATAPIGRPLANTQAYVLDDALQPVPIGVAGELYLSGAGQARGYLGRPDLTAERFIPNPFAGVLGVGCWVLEESAPNTQHPTPVTRLYKTGDRARYRADGVIEYLGRRDQQVKLRGFRIELGEIEAALAQHPAVQDAVVLAREEGAGEKRLVAYVVPKIEDRGLKIEDSGSSAPEPLSSILYPLSSELRDFLQTKLPDHMVPAAFVVQEALPLTPSGKVDRRALPAPDAARMQLQGAFVPPRDTLELQLVRIWEDILATAPIGVTANFFELGGHSLLAIRLMTRIQQQFGRKLALPTLFQGATIEHLARALRHRNDSLPTSPLVAIQPGGAKPPFFCVHPISGSVLGYADLARHLDPDQPLYGLQAPGLEGEQEPYNRVEDLAAHYLAALRSVQPDGPYLLGGWSLGGIIAFEMAQQLQKHGQEVVMLALLDSWAPAHFTQAEIADFDDTAILSAFVADLGRGLRHDLALSIADLRQLTPDEQLTAVLERAQHANIVPLDIGPAQIRQRLKVFSANLQAVRAYVPQALSGPIILFRSSAGGGAAFDDPSLGWNELALDPIEVCEVPGDHYSMFGAPHVQVLAEQLQAALDKALASALVIQRRGFDGGGLEGTVPPSHPTLQNQCGEPLERIRSSPDKLNEG